MVRNMVRKRNPEHREVLFEFHEVGKGNSVRVSAIDVTTNTEVVIIGDKRFNEKMLMNQAVRKLKYVLEKKHKES
ncbi:MAG: hypothetical protein HON65_15370, partial [Rhodospirillales bacterium]|nr:hypothetical protein [Rhodospirillales bacterium]